MKADLIIIGAGPGGYETALEAASRGKNVILFNGSQLGGTCLNEGCIPTKCLCRNAEVVSLFKNSEVFGIDDLKFSVDFGKIQQRKNDVVDNLRNGVRQLLKSAKVTVIDAKASFIDSKRVEANGEIFEADNIIIATGSLTKLLPIPGSDLECCLDSTKILNIDFIPPTLIIIGGGVIGMEFASIFNSLGTEVTIIEFAKQILPPFDSDVAKRLKQSLTKRGVKIFTGATAKEIRQDQSYECVLTFEHKGKNEEVRASHILMAVGRKPNLDNLGLDKAGIEYSSKGISVNRDMKTNVDGIYAIGDVNGLMMLAHVASYQGRRALNTIDNRKDHIDFDIVPSAVFTIPECGMVGKTEEQCKAEGIATLIGMSFFRANGKSLALGEPEGFCKLIFRKDDEKLIGAHIMGVEAADLAQQCADLMARGTTRNELSQIIFGHPTISEVIPAACNAAK